MRGYSVATTALALEVDLKWLDNLLSQYRVAGVSQTRQGVQRRLAPRAIHVIATVHRLNRELRIPVATALRFAHDLWESPQNPGSGEMAVVRAGEVALHVSRSEVRARVEAALAEALEMAPRTKRGRPRRRDRDK